MHCHSIRLPWRKCTGCPTKGWVTGKLVAKNQLFHLHPGPQHEAAHCHSISFRYGASTQGDPRSGGSPENWWRKTSCFTCILGLNMRRRTATQYVLPTAQAHL
eukprot:8399679-Pyramimonas_sp.AAC.1